MFVKIVKKDEYTFSGCEIGNIYEVYEDCMPYALILEADRDRVGKRWIHKDSCKTITCPDCKHYGLNNNVCNDRVKNAVRSMQCFEEKDLQYYNKARNEKKLKEYSCKTCVYRGDDKQKCKCGFICIAGNRYQMVSDTQQIIKKQDCEIVAEQNKQSDKNYIAETAKMYGVEIGEQFKIQHAYSKAIYDSVYFFDNTDRVGLFIVGKPDDATSMIKYLVKGECIILKIPWKPEIGERYFYNNVNRDFSTNYENWSGSIFDYAMYKLENCYKTVELARSDREPALKRLGIEND